MKCCIYHDFIWFLVVCKHTPLEAFYSHSIMQKLNKAFVYLNNNKINLLKHNCLNFKLLYSNYPISTFSLIFLTSLKVTIFLLSNNHHPCPHMGLILRQPTSVTCKQQRPRSAYTFVQSDKCLYKRRVFFTL